MKNNKNGTLNWAILLVFTIFFSAFFGIIMTNISIQISEEPQITILNPQSYPIVGKHWEVEFLTEGISDLIINGINDTQFGVDLEDTLIYCGNQSIEYEILNNSIIVKDYFCDEKGIEKSRVLTAGKHHLEFIFGNSIAYANNDASTQPTAIECDGSNDCNILIDSLVIINVSGSTDGESDPITYFIEANFTNLTYVVGRDLENSHHNFTVNYTLPFGHNMSVLINNTELGTISSSDAGTWLEIARISASDLKANTDYFLYASYGLVSSSTTTDCDYRLLGDAGTEFTGLDEPAGSNGDIAQKDYMRKYTTDGTPTDVIMQFKLNSGATCRSANSQIMMFELTNLTQGTDYYYEENSTLFNVPLFGTYQRTANITVTEGNGVDDWFFIASSAIAVDTTDQNPGFYMQFYDFDGASSSMDINMEGEDTTEEHNWGIMQTFENVPANRNIGVRVSSSDANTMFDHRETAIFAINLDVFESSSFVYSGTGVAMPSGMGEIRGLSYTPKTTGDNIIFSSYVAILDNQASGWEDELTINGVVNPVGWTWTGTSVTRKSGHDANDQWPNNIMSYSSLSGGAAAALSLRANDLSNNVGNAEEQSITAFSTKHRKGSNPNVNSSWITYSNVSANMSQITNLTIQVGVTEYNPQASVDDGTTKPALDLEVYNGTEYVDQGFFNLSEQYTGSELDTTDRTFDIQITDPVTLNNWLNDSLQHFRIRALYLDNNGSHSDFINYTEARVIVNATGWVEIGTHTESTTYSWVTSDITDQQCINFRSRSSDITGSGNFSSYYTKGNCLNISHDTTGIVWKNDSLSFGAVNMSLGNGTAYVNLSAPINHNNIIVSCVSGDCGNITNNWTNGVNMGLGTNRTVEFTCLDVEPRSFSAIFTVISNEDPVVDSITVNCDVTPTYGPLTFVNLTTPSTVSITNVNKSTFFDLNATVECFALCGNISATAYYYENLTTQWWDTSYTKRIEINISNAGSTLLSNYPALIDITYDTDMETNFDDIRFVNGTCDSGSSTFELSYEFDNYTSSSDAQAWVNISNLHIGGTQICMYYGNSGAANGEDATAVWDTNYVTVYHFSETAGTVIDSTSYGIDATLTGGGADLSVSGKLNGGISFDGSSCAYLDDAQELNVTDLTYETWFSTTDNSGYYIARTTYDAATRQANFGGVGGSLNFYYPPGTGTFVNWGNNADSSGNWIWSAITVSGTAANAYYDGNTVAGEQTLSSAITQQENGRTVLGARSGGAGSCGYPLAGDLDEVRISNIARSQDWINQTYQMVENQATFVNFGTEQNQLSEKIIGTSISDTPLYSSQNNPQYYAIEKDGTHNFTWNINATGDANSFHNIKVVFGSNYSQIANNETDNATVKIIDIVIVSITSPLNNTKIFDTENLIASLTSNKNLVWAGFYSDGNSGNVVNLNTSDNRYWYGNISTPTYGYHNITFLYNFTQPIQNYSGTHNFRYLSDSYRSINKEISFVSTDMYLLNLTVRNRLNKSADSHTIDFVDTTFNIGAQTPSSDFTNVTYWSFPGNTYIWNLTLTPLSNTSISYPVAGVGDYELLGNFMTALE